MKVLGHEFVEMTKVDWYGYAGAEPGTLICRLDDCDLLYDPNTRVVSEIKTDGEGGMSQTDWSPEVIV